MTHLSSSVCYCDKVLSEINFLFRKCIMWCNSCLIPNIKTEKGKFSPKAVSDQRTTVIYKEVVLLLSSQTVLYLWVCSDMTLSWSVHADSLCSELQHRSCFLCRLTAFWIWVEVYAVFLTCSARKQHLIQYHSLVWKSVCTTAWSGAVSS